MPTEVRTSRSHPLQVFWIGPANHGSSGRLGLTFAPGKRGGGLITGARWERDLEADLDRLKNHFGTNLLVSLMEPFEYDMLGIPNLFQAAEARGIRVQHLPIIDVNVPTEAQWADVKAVVNLIREHLNDGHNVVVHCRGGRGRTGTIVSLVLTTYGHTAHEAISITRQAQPGAVETQEQADYVRKAAERLTQEGT